MNSVLILFLGIVIVICLVTLAVYLTSDYLVQNSASLNVSTTNKNTFDPSSFDSPGSSRYYYEGWFFITGNQNANAENILFNREKDFVVTLNGSTLNLYVNANSGEKSPENTFKANGLSPLISVPQFPFQKWAHLVINVDAMSVDLYIDGKFVQNKISPTTINSTATTAITYGNKYTIGHLAQFRRPAENINPQGVWNHYLRGSGQSQSLTDYHLNAVVTKNGRNTMNKRVV